MAIDVHQALGEPQVSSDDSVSDFPGRVGYLPEDVDAIVFAQFGVQGANQPGAETLISELTDLLAGDGAPKYVDRTLSNGASGHSTLIFMAYWFDLDQYRRWNSEFGSWWASHDPTLLGDVGLWREVLVTPADSFHFNAAGDRPVGAARAFELERSPKFGYWGGYRDRTPRSAWDALDSPFGQTLPPPRTRDTRGRKVTVHAPPNLCFVREGQDWSECGSAERAVWDSKLEPVLMRWVEHLATEPEVSGCCSVWQGRDCQETDMAPLDSFTVNAYFLSLGHLERDARSHPTHLAVVNTYVKTLEELQRSNPDFDTELYLWAEAHILPEGHVKAEYINCNGTTGLLPYFHTVDLI